MGILKSLTEKGIYIVQGNFPKGIRDILLATPIHPEEGEEGLVEASHKKYLGNNTLAHYWVEKGLRRSLDDQEFNKLIANCTHSCIQRIREGEQLPLHKDKENDEGLLYIVIAYFTDTNSYSGRELYWIDREDKTIKYHKPKNGDIIILDTEIEHGVNMLTSNDNITTFVIRINNEDISNTI